MSDKEKLAELITKAKRSMWGKSGLSSELAKNMYLAENLIANGVRLEEKQATSDGWIPVTERRPEKDVRVLVWVGENSCNFPVIDTDRIHCGRWVRWDERITHWMPLPEPPKGE